MIQLLPFFFGDTVTLNWKTLVAWPSVPQQIALFEALPLVAFAVVIDKLQILEILAFFMKHGFLHFSHALFALKMQIPCICGVPVVVFYVSLPFWLQNSLASYELHHSNLLL